MGKWMFNIKTNDIQEFISREQVITASIFKPFTIPPKADS